MRVIAWSALIVVVFTAAAAWAEASRERGPNVVIIVADDLGYADVGCQGQSRDVRTPNIDSIAKAGVRFTNGYVSCPVCSPTRAGLMTGRYQQRFGFEQNPLEKEIDRFGLPLDEITLPAQMKKAGYVTGMVGKWHLGDRPEFRPPKRGFDEFFGFVGGAHGYVNNKVAATKSANAIRRGDEPVGESAYLTDAFSREAVSFIERHKSEPFFLYLPYNAVHTPQQAPPKYVARFKNVKDKRRQMALAMLSALDDGVGRVLDKLREHKLEENTLVIFFSDNGGPTQANGSRNTPFRGHKGETLEGGIRIPFMMQWPGHLPAAKVDDRVIVQLDIFPTVLGVAGGDVPKDRTIDGKDLLPYLMGKNAEPVHNALYWRFGPRRAMLTGDWKLHWNGDEPPQLFDLAKDPGETNDLAAANAPVVERMMASWKEWDAQLMKPRWHGKLEGGPEHADPNPGDVKDEADGDDNAS